MIIRVKVRPNSKSDLLVKTGEREYSAEIREPAEDNKANNALVRLLCKEFKVNFKQIKIKNPTSKSKVVEIKPDIKI